MRLFSVSNILQQNVIKVPNNFARPCAVILEMLLINQIVGLSIGRLVYYISYSC